MMQPLILEIWGIGDDDEVTLLRNYGKEYKAEFHLEGNAPLPREVLERFSIKTIVVGGERSEIGTIPFPNLIFNAICDPDFHKKSLEWVNKISNSVGDVPLVNPPEAVRHTRRDKVVEIAKDIKGLIAPETVRLVPESIEEVERLYRERMDGLAVLFRPAGKEAGQGLIRVESAKTLKEVLERYVVNGREAYYMTRFVDYRSEDGYFRKYRCFFIDGEIYPSHLIISKEWQIHHDLMDTDDRKEQLKKEEKEFLDLFEEGLFEPLRRLGERVGLDIAGIDFGVDSSGRIVLFEYNACMNPFSMEKSSEYYDAAYRAQITEAIEAMLQKKMVAN